MGNSPGEPAHAGSQSGERWSRCAGQAMIGGPPRRNP